MLRKVWFLPVFSADYSNESIRVKLFIFYAVEMIKQSQVVKGPLKRVL